GHVASDSLSVVVTNIYGFVFTDRFCLIIPTRFIAIIISRRIFIALNGFGSIAINGQGLVILDLGIKILFRMQLNLLIASFIFKTQLIVVLRRAVFSRTGFDTTLGFGRISRLVPAVI